MWFTLSYGYTYTIVTYNFLIPESDLFQGASSGSYGRGPWTGRSSSLPDPDADLEL